MSREREERKQREYSQVKGLVPVGVEGALDCGGGLCAFAIDGDDGKGIGDTEDITLRETVGGDDWRRGEKRERRKRVEEEKRVS